MNYDQVEEWLNNREAKGIKLGLDRIRAAAAELGSPQDKLKVILVAGTNGKGSTTSAISRLLHQKGYKVGTYLSPHLVYYTERYLINNVQIAPAEFASLINKIILSNVHNMYDLTVFEILTLAGYVFFESNKVDFAVVEVGLGGRFDATNIVDPVCSVITPIGFDHMDILGDTLYKIAFEKAGIIKKDGKIFTAEQPQEALKALQDKAGDEYAELRIVKKDNALDAPVDYQKQNLALAFEVVDFLLGLEKDASTVHADSGEGFLGILSSEEKTIFCKSFSFAGRFEIVRTRPYLILDGAHNEMGMHNLLESLSRTYPQSGIIIMAGLLKRKSALGVLNQIAEWSGSGQLKEINFVNIPGQNCYNPEELLSLWQDMLCSKGIASNILPEIRLKQLLDTAGSDQIIVCCGSLYLIGHIKKYLLR